MIAFGELYLNGGRRNDTPIVPESWVRTSCEPRTTSRWGSDRRYGYGWWIRELGGRETCFAWGYGGQYIFVFRDLDLVVVATSSTNVDDERRGYRRALFDVIEQTVIPAIATDEPARN
jgi:CubicO group peptidase (beta-lactamase class C family)